MWAKTGQEHLNWLKIERKKSEIELIKRLQDDAENPHT